MSMREIAECMAAALADGRDVVLVTIAGGKGSAPRHAGSQMLVDAEGLACGTIGGGALEAHAIAQARALLGSGHGRFEQLTWAWRAAGVQACCTRPCAAAMRAGRS